jgi:hypothetical protein
MDTVLFMRSPAFGLSLIVPPVLQLMLFGFALSATVTNLRLGVVDESKSPESRELVARLIESKSFRLGGDYFAANDMGAAISQGQTGRRRRDPLSLRPRSAARAFCTIQFLLNAGSSRLGSSASCWLVHQASPRRRAVRGRSGEAVLPSDGRMGFSRGKSPPLRYG